MPFLRLTGRLLPTAVLILGLLGSPFTAESQSPPKSPRIGFLGAASPSGYASQIEAFRKGLRDLGRPTFIDDWMLEGRVGLG